MKTTNDTIRNQTHNLPAGGAVIHITERLKIKKIELLPDLFVSRLMCSVFDSSWYHY